MKSGLYRQQNRRILFWAALAVVIGFAAFAAFFRLDASAVNSWDEARHGVNAYEMMRTGNFIVNSYRYQPDYWNLKPPLSFWAIMLDFRLFGTTVLALRFYSAVSIFLTVLAAARFVYKRYGQVACVVVTALLACENMLYRYHFGRNGDADALFGLLSTLCILFAFRSQIQKRWLCLSGLCFSFAFLDKSWHACILLAIVGLYLLGTRELFHLGARIWAGMLACAFGPIAAWAAWRYAADGTAFFKGMVDRDLLARSSRPLEGHSGGALYYVTLSLFHNMIGILVLAVLCALIAWLVGRRGRIAKPHRRDVLLFALWIGLPYLFFSMAETKYDWYIIPTVIPLCIVSGIVCGSAWTHADSLRRRILAALLAGAVVVAVGWNGLETIQTVAISGSIIPIQEFLRGSVAADARGRTAYIVHGNGDSDWQQNEVYVGEAYADLHCEYGGLADFRKHPGSVAIVSVQYFAKQRELTGSVHILAQKDGYILLEQPQTPS